MHFLLIFSFLFFSCMGSLISINQDEFVLLDDYFEENSNIAVVHGDGNRILRRLLDYTIEELMQIEELNVIPKNILKKKMRDFPYNLMQDDFSSTKELNSSHFSKKNMRIYLNVQRKLNTDYILVVWIPQLTIYTYDFFKKVRLTVCSRLIKYPENIVSGYSYIIRTNNFPLGMDENEAINVELKNAASKLAVGMAHKLFYND